MQVPRHRLVDAAAVPVVLVEDRARHGVPRLHEATGVLVAGHVAPDQLEGHRALDGQGLARRGEGAGDQLVAQIEQRRELAGAADAAGGARAKAGGREAHAGRRGRGRPGGHGPFEAVGVGSLVHWRCTPAASTGHGSPSTSTRRIIVQKSCANPRPEAPIGRLPMPSGVVWCRRRGRRPTPATTPNSRSNPPANSTAHNETPPYAPPAPNAAPEQIIHPLHVHIPAIHPGLPPGNRLSPNTNNPSPENAPAPPPAPAHQTRSAPPHHHHSNTLTHRHPSHPPLRRTAHPPTIKPRRRHRSQSLAPTTNHPSWSTHHNAARRSPRHPMRPRQDPSSTCFSSGRAERVERSSRSARRERRLAHGGCCHAQQPQRAERTGHRLQEPDRC